MGSFLAGAVALTATGCATKSIEWTELPAVPDQLGLAGTFAGYSNGTHCIAGGTNFPDKMPWEGGIKQWHAGVYTLADGGHAWAAAGSLPQPTGHGSCNTTRDGIIFIGGGDMTTHFANVTRVRIEGGKATFEALPPLPYPLAFHASAVLGNMLYVAGGISGPKDTAARREVACLDLAEPSKGWQQIGPFPGAGRLMPVMAAQDGALFIAGGASLAPDAEGKPKRTYLVDGWKFTTVAGWSSIAPLPRPAVAAPSPAPNHGRSQFLVLGGDAGDHLPPIVPLPEHPGFHRDILAYDTRKDSWEVVGTLPFGQVTAPAYTDIHGHIVVVSGEVRPGVRSPRVWSGETTE